MTGIVVVSHSRALAAAAVELAEQMVPVEQRPVVEIAAGVDGGLGTDALAIMDAVTAADDPDGVLVLMDLGSALLSAEMAVEMLDAQLAARVRLSAAPLVEGLVAAVVTAASGAGVDEVDREACGALQAKAGQLAPAEDRPAPSRTDTDEATGAVVWRTVLAMEHGLHARPSAALALALGQHDVTSRVVVTRTGQAADGDSIMEVQALGARQGDELVVHLDGPGARQAAVALDELAGRNFDESPRPCAVPHPQVPRGPVVALELDVDLGRYVPGDPEEEVERLDAALQAADDFLADLVAMAEQEALVRDDLTSPAVLGAVRAILHDPMLDKGFRQQIALVPDASRAVRTTMRASAAVFERMANPYLRERATDLRALERVVLCGLVDRDPSLAELPDGHVVEVAELDALTAAQLDPSSCPGVRVRAAGEAGHGVLVARARGLAVSVGAAR